jgi:hypothetical protein
LAWSGGTSRTRAAQPHSSRSVHAVRRGILVQDSC